MKSSNPQLFNYKIEYRPKYIRTKKINPNYEFSDIVGVLDDITTLLKGKHCGFYNKLPLYIPLRVNPHYSFGLVINIIEPFQKGKTDIEFLSVYYDEEEKGANPYALTANDRFLFRDDYKKGIDIIKSCAGHFGYTKSRLEQHHYFIQDFYIGEKREPTIKSIIPKLKGKNDVLITKYDKLNAYINGLEKGIAYNRIEQKNMAKLIFNRFNIGIGNDEKLIKKPRYYLNKALKYTDFEVVSATTKGYHSMSDYFGICLIIPKKENEQLSYFDEIDKTIKNIVYQS